MTASEVMTTEVITLFCEQSAEEAIRALVESGISGAPVVDGRGMLAGIISEFQLLEVIYDSQSRYDPVGELMTRDVLTVTESTPLTEVANLFVVHRIRRVPVVRGGRLVGLVSRRDLLQFFLGQCEQSGDLLRFLQMRRDKGGPAEGASARQPVDRLPVHAPSVTD